MKRRVVRPAWLLAFALIPVQVAADPIAITSGFFSSQGPHTSALNFALEGQDFRASGSMGGGEVGPDNTCAPYAPGDVISLSSTFLASLGSGTALVDGTAYAATGFAAYDFLLDAPSIVTPGTAGAFTVTRPFTFTGRLTGVDPADETFTPIFEKLLAGRGLVTATFVEDVFPTPLFSLGSVRYDFSEAAPVPEPATFLLVATGVGAALRLRRRAGRAS
jgi:hypothetical protein